MNDKKPNTGMKILLVLLVVAIILFFVAPGYLFNGQMGYYRSHFNTLIIDQINSLETPLKSIAQSIGGFFSGFRLR